MDKNNGGPNQFPPLADMGKLERLHIDVTDRINDMLITFQDASYKVGLERGRKESEKAWPALRDLVSGLNETWWSSWQTTSHFGDALNKAAELLRAREQ
ncbi:hypothetical protein R16034_00856 [Ralstonia edaphis]|uniref:Uncharacterized protein n=1 Tax=Ralstonia edaphi TaxID=3058599 RepID=A0AB72X4K5_9RALS|nr:hypothetical protein [Ralstonia sp. LMG 6871]CAJ0737810.1 hypothetical protein R16034_00856 [Ralstonia sp. LMG 6871]